MLQTVAAEVRELLTQWCVNHLGFVPLELTLLVVETENKPFAHLQRWNNLELHRVIG